MLNLISLSKHWIVVLLLTLLQLFAAAFILGQEYSPDSSANPYGSQSGPSDSYQQGAGFDAMRARCSGPNPGPECAALGTGASSGMPSFGGSSSGVPQIYSDDEATYLGRYSSAFNYPKSYRLPPQPPTDFQKLVFASVGQRLPIFGSNLFMSASSTFAPLDRAPVPADYVVGPGDQLQIRGWGQVDINVRTTVDRNGSIYIPKVGEVTVTGIKYSELTPYLKGVISRNFRNFDLNVSMGRLRSIQVLIVGQARRPGSYTVSSLSTLVNALFYSGGPLNTGSMRHIQLRRNDKVVVEFDLYDLLLNGDKSKDATLLPGDVIFIPPVGPQVAIVGSVNSPAIYELKDKTTLAQAVKLAGGFTALTDDNKATVERVVQGDQHTFRKVEDFPLNETGLNAELKNGDIVRIAPMLPRFENTVTLRGNVAWPGRYPWHEGMRIRDLIPSKEALLTRDFWRQQNPVYSASGEVRLSPNAGYQPRPESPTQAGQQPAGPQGSWGSEEQSSIEPTGELTPQNQARAAEGAAATGNTATTTPAAHPPQQATYAASTVSLGETRLRNEIKATAPEINWDYAVIQRINRTDLSTTLIPFNLGKAILDNDESQNLLLEPGDVVTIFSQQDIKVPIERQVKFVRLEGEFVASGVYRVEPGETLRHLVERVGGLTPNAYLFGSEFTRESTRERQEQELNRIIGDLQVQVEQNASTQAAAAVTPEDAALLSSSVQGQRQVVEKLRQLRPNGRIVLGLPGPRATIQNLPEIQLEDGDRFVVPSKPASVEVLGSVYNANAFIWRTGKRAGDYLRDAGGPNRNADKKHIFVLRADGAVVGTTSTSGFWGGGVENYRMEPGDALVVPQNLAKGAFVRNFRDWTQIFSQLAFGAASIAVLSGL